MSDSGIDGVTLSFDEVSLVGRNDEVELLTNIYKDVSNPLYNGRDLVLVSGQSGTGKTSLLKCLKNEIQDGFFVMCKFDQQLSGHYDSVFFEAIDDLCRAVLKHKCLSQVGKELREQLGSTLILLCRLMPSLKAVLGLHDEDMAKHPSDEFQHRFERIKYGIRGILRTICNHDRPCIILVDDLQWANPQTIELMKYIATDEDCRGLLMTGTYRDNEVDETHPVHRLITDLNALENMRMTEISIRDLQEEHINNMLAQATGRCPEDTLELAKVVYQKTYGNGFFTVKFLENLQEEGFLFFSNQQYRWVWNLEKIKSETGVSNNVVDFMTKKMKRLPKDTLAILTTGSCLGQRFEASIVAQVVYKGWLTDDDTKLKKTLKNLEIALEHGLVIKSPDMDLFKFAHDRIQQVAYILLAEGVQRDTVHFEIGLLFWELIVENQEDEIPSWLYPAAAQQLNLAESFRPCVGEQEAFDLAVLNLQAAKVSRSRSAFFPAMNFAQSAFDLLDPETMWTSHYSLTLELCTLSAEVYLITGNFEQCAKFANLVEEHAQTMEERSQSMLVLMESLGVQGKFKQAIKFAGKSLLSLGYQFPKNPSPLHVIKHLYKTKNKLKKYSEDDLISIPHCQDAIANVAMKLMSRGYLFSWFCVDKWYLAMFVLRLAQTSLAKGISKSSAIGFYGFGFILGETFGDYDACYKYGEVALRLQESIEGFEGGLANTIVHLFCHHLKNPITKCLEPMLQSYRIGMLQGDPTESIIAAISYCITYYDQGLALGPLYRDLVAYEKEAIAYKRHLQVSTINAKRNSVGMLLGKCDHIDPDGYYAEALRTNDRNAFQQFRCYDLMSNLILSDWEKCRECLDFFEYDAGELLTARTCCTFAHFDFCRTIAGLYCWHTTKKRIYKRRSRQLTKVLNDGLNKKWAYCQHLCMIIDAFSLGLLWDQHKDDIMVKHKYDKAIILATKSGHLHHAALASELAASFLMKAGNYDIAEVYWSEALKKYMRWGATEKVRRMELGQVEFLRKMNHETTSGSHSVRGRYARERYDRRFSMAHSSFELDYCRSSSFFSASSHELRDSRAAAKK